MEDLAITIQRGLAVAGTRWGGFVFPIRPYLLFSDYRDALLGGLFDISQFRLESTDLQGMSALEEAILDSGGQAFDVVLGDYIVGEQTRGQVVGTSAGPNPALLARQRAWDDSNRAYLGMINEASQQMWPLVHGTSVGPPSEYVDYVRIALDSQGEAVWVEWTEEIVSDAPYSGEVIIHPEDQPEYDRLEAECVSIYARRERQIGARPVETQSNVLQVKAADVTRMIRMQLGDQIISEGNVPMRMQIEAKYDFYDWSVPRECASAFRKTAVQWLAAYKWSRYRELVAAASGAWSKEAAADEEFWADFLLGLDVFDDF